MTNGISLSRRELDLPDIMNDYKPAGNNEKRILHCGIFLHKRLIRYT